MEKITQIEQLDRNIHKLQMRICFWELEDKGLHPSQFWMLDLLERAGAVSQTDLARRAGVSAASIGTSVRRLERNGYVRRSTDESDGRVTNVELTDKGLDCAAAALAYGERLAQIKFRGFSPQELEQYQLYMQRILANYQQYYEELEGKQD